MTFDTFIRRLNEVRDISRIENGYSHIVYELLCNDVLDNEKYMLVDTSTYQKRSNRPLIVDFLRAVPDFVITNRTSERNHIKRLGCVEVKFFGRDVEAHLMSLQHNRLINYYKQEGYLSVYNNNVLYTNGWKWNYYKSNEPLWSFDFTVDKNCNQEYFEELIAKLKEIAWEKID